MINEKKYSFECKNLVRIKYNEKLNISDIKKLIVNKIK